MLKKKNAGKLHFEITFLPYVETAVVQHEKQEENFQKVKNEPIHEQKVQKEKHEPIDDQKVQNEKQEEKVQKEKQEPIDDQKVQNEKEI